MDDDLVKNLAALETTTIDGARYRYTRPTAEPLASSTAGNRWSPPITCPSLYFSSTGDAAIAEAYRRIVEGQDIQIPPGDITLRLWTVEVNVDNVLDLRSREARLAVGLSDDDVFSEVSHYHRCQAVGAVAHQLGRHGVIAPSATRIGETLVLYEHNLPFEQFPVEIGSEILDGLPPDPRRLRLADEETRPQ